MAGEEVTREIFRLLPDWQVLTFYAITIITIVVVVIGVLYKLSRYGWKTIFKPEGGFWKRLWKAITSMIFNSTVLHNNRFIGLMHLAIFYGILVLLAGTALVTLEEDILKIFAPQFMFFHGDFYVLFSFGMDIIGLLVLAALAFMIGRRIYLRKKRMSYATIKEKGIRKISILDDWFFIIMLFIIVLSGYIVEGLRLVADGPSTEPYAFVGAGLASVFQAIGITPGLANAMFPTAWWFHGILALVTLAYIPFSKIWHIFSGFLSVMLSDENAGKALPKVEEPTEEEPEDAPSPAIAAASNPKPAKYFTGRELLMLDACVRCGRCHDACPAKNSGFPLSPRDMIMGLRLKSGGKGTNGKALSEYITKETLWSCTSCFACMETCPMKIEHLPFIINLRRELLNEGEVDAQVQETLEKLTRYGNSFGKSDRMRAKWTKGLDFKIKDARKQEVEYLWFVGDYASYDERLVGITQKVAKIFNAAGINFGLLYEAERNSGNDVRRIGEEGLYEMLVEKNLDGLGRAKFNKIITTDPHTYNTLKNEYSQFNGGNDGFEIIHYTELLSDLIQTGKLTLKNELDYTVTYHDPCYLGRYNDIYDEPRKILDAVGVRLVEMDRHKGTTYCCGAGGGRIWMEDMPGIEERPADNRIREAVDLPTVEMFIVACPKDFVMFGDAIKTTDNEGRIVVKDIAELVYEAMGFEETKKEWE